MKRSDRLTKSEDFERVRRNGKPYAHPLVVLIRLPNGTDKTRTGVAAGKSLGNAVKRNRAKRLLRAAVGPLLPQIQAGHDIILLARRPILEVKTQQVQVALETLLGRAKMVIER